MNNSMAGMLAGLAAGAIAGGALMLTKKGQEMNSAMNDAFDLFDKKGSKYLPSLNKGEDLIED